MKRVRVEWDLFGILTLYFQKRDLLETDESTFLNDRAAIMHGRDVKLAKEEGISGKVGTTEEYHTLVKDILSSAGVSIRQSCYSGLPLVLLQRGGRMQFSFQRSDDTKTYYENYLLGLLIWCASLEQLLFNRASLKSASSKMEFLQSVARWWRDGAANRADASWSPSPVKLTPSEKRVVKAKHGRQET